MSLHLELGSMIDTDFDAVLDCPTEQKQDAVIVRLKNGVTVHVRYAATDAYSLRWNHDGAESGIDTAPLHPDLSSFPNHMHAADGRIVADPITDPDASPADNLQRLIRALLDNPMLGTTGRA